MSDRLDWDSYFMGIAVAVAQRSEDTSIKHGTVLVSKATNIILGTGYNGLIPGLDKSLVDTESRPEKYKWFRHSEENAILNSSQPLRFVQGGVKAYVTGRPCLNCLSMLSSCQVFDIFVLNRRGYLREPSKQDMDDFYLVVDEKSINVVWMEISSVDWLAGVSV